MNNSYIANTYISQRDISMHIVVCLSYKDLYVFHNNAIYFLKIPVRFVLCILLHNCNCNVYSSSVLLAISFNVQNK